MLALEGLTAESVTSVAGAFLESLPASRLGVLEGEGLSFAPPVPRYRITADILDRSGLGETAYRWGWRYFLAVGDQLLPLAVDVRPGRDAGSWRAGLAAGPHLARQLAIIEWLSRDASLSGALRVLDAPGLDWSGIWVTGAETRLISLQSGEPWTSCV